MTKVKLAISQGDPNGIGMELILRMFADASVHKYCIPVLYGSVKTFVHYKKMLGLEEPRYNLIRSAEEAVENKLNLIPCGDEEFVPEPGTPSSAAGAMAFAALEKMVSEAHKVDALLTAPLDKSTVAESVPGFTGHTGYLAAEMGAASHAMMLVSEDLRVALATEHIPVTELGKHLNTDSLVAKLELMQTALKEDFGLTKPRIAVLGLNPHAGDNGLLGKEEQSIIKPAIQTLFDRGRLVYGPYSADAFFGGGQYKAFDAVLAMYHDQGLVGFKTLAFHEGVNVTVGLPVVRTSPDHGTAYDLAGKNQASLESFQSALFEAIHLVRRRLQFAEDYDNPLPFAELRRERFRIDF